MSRALARLVPIVLAAGAALVLVGLGVHASRMEAELARRSVSAAAEAGAHRLGRALDTLAAEFASGLPSPDDAVDPETVLSSVRHLYPVRFVDADGRALYGAGAPEAEAFVREAIASAGRLGDDAAGLEAQGAFLRAAASAAPEAAAVSALAIAADAADGTLVAPDAPESAAERLEALASGAIVRDPDGVLDAAERVAKPGARRAVAGVRREWIAIRRAAREVTASRQAAVVLVEREDGLGMVVVAPLKLWRGAEAAALPANAPPVGVSALLVGDVPSATLRARVVAEAEAIVRETQVRRVALSGPSGADVVHATTPGWNATGAGVSMVLTTSLATRFRDWRIETVAEETARVGGLGDLTLAASVVAGLSLVGAVTVLVRTADRQARLAAERQTFLDHVAHEVRTPAGALLALSEELAAGHVPPARQPIYHQHLATESRRLARLVEDTLDLSRLDAGRLVLASTPADLREVVAAGIEAAGATGRVTYRAPPEPLVVACDPAALRRVVRNLVDNAFRHGAAEPPPEVTVSADGMDARVVVKDRGPGIAAEDLPRLFERFRRKPSATHETKGVGVGLAISREIARAHFGEISARAPQEGGAEFTLRIPCEGRAS